MIFFDEMLICDRIWENPAYHKFHKFLVSYIFDKLFHRANSRSNLRLTARFAEELQHFVCDRTITPTIEKLLSKGIAMHTYGVSIYYAYTGSQLNGPRKSCSK